MGGLRSTYEKGAMYKGFSWVDMRKREHLEDLGIDGFPRSEMRRYGISLTRDRDRCRALVNAAMNLLVHKGREIS
jgi:hypothetical protein